MKARNIFSALLVVTLSTGLIAAPVAYGGDPEPPKVFLPVVFGGPTSDGAMPIPANPSSCVNEARVAISDVSVVSQPNNGNGARPIQYLRDEQNIAQSSPNVKPTPHPSTIYIPGWSTAPGATTQIKFDLGQSRCLKRIWLYDDQGTGNLLVYFSQTGAPGSWGNPAHTLNLDLYKAWRSLDINSVQVRYVLLEFTGQTGLGEVLINAGSNPVTPTPTATATATATRTPPAPTSTPTPAATPPPGNPAQLKNDVFGVCGPDTKMVSLTASQISIAAGSNTSGWQFPARLVDGVLGDGWSPGSPGPQIAEIDFGGTAQVTKIRAHTWHNGALQITFANANTPSQSWSLSSANGSGWQAPIAVNTALSKVTLRDQAPSGSVTEVVFCVAGITTTLKPDLVVADAQITPQSGNSCYVQGELLGTTVTVKNIGDVAAGAFSVRLNNNGPMQVSGLAPNASASVWFPGDNNTSANAVVDTTNVIDESNETNNTLSKTLTQPNVCSTSNTLPRRNATGGLVTGQSVGGPDRLYLSAGFGAWSQAPGITGTLTQDCIELHDAYWVTAPRPDLPPSANNKVYHTWHKPSEIHPVTGEGCVYGHEHGHDPSTAEWGMFEYSGGWPAFGYVLEQHMMRVTGHINTNDATHTHGGTPVHRHEEHTGHKVFVTKFRAAIGNPPNTELPLYDAGFDCVVLSKLHQGTFSDDAATNHLHEYFLTVACKDGLDKQNTTVRTKFSIKTLVPFGAPNQFKNTCFKNDDGKNIVNVAANSVPGLRIKDPTSPFVPLAEETTPTQPLSGANALNPREFSCINPNDGKFVNGSVDHISQFDLWRQPYSVEGPKNVQVSFGPYYIAKDSARGHDNFPPLGNGDAYVSQTAPITFTVNMCARYPTLKFCAGVSALNNPLNPYSTQSPFKGALRAINFKDFTIYNNNDWGSGGPIARPDEAFCTNEFGKLESPTTPSTPNSDGTCSGFLVLQKIAPFTGANLGNAADDTLGTNKKWTNADGVSGHVGGALWVFGQTMRYPIDADAYVMAAPNTLIKPNGKQCPLGPIAAANWLPEGGYAVVPLGKESTAYCPVGIGFERVVDMRNSIEPEVVALVKQKPGTSETYNTGLHAPN
jgi:hypothetical protein